VKGLDGDMMLDGRKSARLRNGETVEGRQLDERTLAVLDRQESAGLRYDTVRRQLDERSLAVLDGRDSASWVYDGVAGRETAE
jgi:hypothetical protein